MCGSGRVSGLGSGESSECRGPCPPPGGVLGRPPRSSGVFVSRFVSRNDVNIPQGTDFSLDSNRRYRPEMSGKQLQPERNGIAADSEPGYSRPKSDDGPAMPFPLGHFTTGNTRCG